MKKRSLNVAAILKNSCSSGPGIRDVIWVQGCSIGCKGCINQSFLPHEPRKIISVDVLLKHFKARRNKIDGCTLLGGEPTEQPEAVGELLQGIKKLGLSTIVFSGNSLSKLQKKSQYKKILENTDLLIDEPFISELYQEDLYLRGSINQNFHFLGDQWTSETFPKNKVTGEVIIQENKMRMQGIGITNMLTFDKVD